MENKLDDRRKYSASIYHPSKDVYITIVTSEERDGKKYTQIEYKTDRGEDAAPSLTVKAGQLAKIDLELNEDGEWKGSIDVPIPPQTMAEAIPPSMCFGSCEPYQKTCELGETPECVGDELKCTRRRNEFEAE